MSNKPNKTTYEELKAKGKLVSIGSRCSWYSYNGLEYILTNEHENYVGLNNNEEANELYEKLERFKR